MTDVLRQTSEQYETRMSALATQIADAENNIAAWKKQLVDIEAAKAHIDSKLPKDKPAKAADTAMKP